MARTRSARTCVAATCGRAEFRARWAPSIAPYIVPEADRRLSGEPGVFPVMIELEKLWSPLFFRAFRGKTGIRFRRERYR